MANSKTLTFYSVVNSRKNFPAANDFEILHQVRRRCDGIMSAILAISGDALSRHEALKFVVFANVSVTGRCSAEVFFWQCQKKDVNLQSDNLVDCRELLTGHIRK